MVLWGPDASAQEKPNPASAAPAAQADGNPDGQLIGVLLGGSVISQQADSFSQADPFFGFLVGYRSQGRPLGGRLNLRFQGIFDVQPQKAAAPETETDDGGGEADPSTFQPFLASRKTFDIDMHLFVEYPMSGNFTLGPYLAGGVSTLIDPNELTNDQVAKAEDTSPAQPKQLDLTRALSQNDVEAYFEAGVVGNFFISDTKLFIQAMMLYGNYEALADLVPGVNTRNRFVAKLRIFPVGLDIRHDGQPTMTPMFGVELNAGTGPDQMKFFTGVAISINKFK
jgi:hypothetical protein